MAPVCYGWFKNLENYILTNIIWEIYVTAEDFHANWRIDQIITSPIFIKICIIVHYGQSFKLVVEFGRFESQVSFHNGGDMK